MRVRSVCFVPVTSLLLICVLFTRPHSSHGFLTDFLNFLTNAIFPISRSSPQPQSQFFSRPSRQLNVQPAETESETVKCFGELGCIENTDEWFHYLHRPFNLLPQDRRHVNTRFGFFNRNRTIDPTDVFLNGTHLLEQGFDPEKPVKFIVHGFLDSGFSYWVIRLAQALLIAGDFNVFVVDWGVGALPLYTQATANTRLVGLEIAHYAQFLRRELQVEAENIHCIGHSLGAHVCGYAGEKIPGLGRITGLDPAEPYYQYLPTMVRLDPSDARFVDVVHTDGRTILLLGLGMIQPCGHVDFYPNDGKEQPGCELTEIPMNIFHLHGYEEVEREIVACNHHRAVYYFIEAVLNRCQFVGHMCHDYQAYLKGRCWSCGENGSSCAKMGLDADKYNIGGRSLVKFYLSTAKAAPFCVRHYRVNIQLARPEQAADWVTGKLKIGLVGMQSSLNEINLTPSDNSRFHHGKNLTFIVQNTKALGNIKQVKIEWKFSDGYFGYMASCWMTGCNNKLFIKRIDVIDMDQVDNFQVQRADFQFANLPSASALCGPENAKFTGIRSGSSALFERQC